MGAGGADGTDRRQSASPATELDRIMSQQFRKQEAPADEEKKDASPVGGGLAKKIQSQKSSPAGGGIVASAINSINKQQKGERPATTKANNLASSNTKIPISVAPSSTKSAAE